MPLLEAVSYWVPYLDSYEGIQQAISAFDVSGRRG